MRISAPQTFEGKLIVSFLVVFGTPLYFLSIGLIGNAIAKSQLKRIVKTGTALKIGGFTFGILVILALVTCVPAAIIQVIDQFIDLFFNFIVFQSRFWILRISYSISF